jgi:hypothetical protein
LFDATPGKPLSMTRSEGVDPVIASLPRCWRARDRKGLTTTLLAFLGLSLIPAVGAEAAEPGTSPSGPKSDIRIVAVHPPKLTLGGESICAARRRGSDRLKGDNSKPPVVTLDGRVLTSIIGYDSGNADTLIFDIARSAQDQPAWAPLLGMDKPRDLVLRIQGPGTTPFDSLRSTRTAPGPSSWRARS